MGVLGQRLLELRQAAELTQAALAARIKTSEGFISAVETGRKLPSIATTVAMARALGCEQQELLDLLTQEKLAAAERTEVAFVPTSTDIPEALRALVAAMLADPEFCRAVQDLHKALQVLSARRRAVLLGLIADYATEAQ